MLNFAEIHFQHFLNPVGNYCQCSNHSYMQEIKIVTESVLGFVFPKPSYISVFCCFLCDFSRNQPSGATNNLF